jgi:hypothetical protein
MTDTFKSGQWRICSGCLASIKPRDRACYLYDEVHCMDCLTESEEKAVNELTKLSQEMERIDSTGHVTVIPADLYDELMEEEQQ